MKASESGQSLVETIVAAGIAAIALIAVFGGLIAASHRFGADPAARAMDFAVRQELRVAIDLSKYDGSSLAPATIATTVPIPGASPLPVHLALAVVQLANGRRITVSATADGNSSLQANASIAIGSPAPRPGAVVTAPPAAAPAGAP